MRITGFSPQSPLSAQWTQPLPTALYTFFNERDAYVPTNLLPPKLVHCASSRPSHGILVRSESAPQIDTDQLLAKMRKAGWREMGELLDRWETNDPSVESFLREVYKTQRHSRIASAGELPWRVCTLMLLEDLRRSNAQFMEPTHNIYNFPRTGHKYRKDQRELLEKLFLGFPPHYFGRDHLHERVIQELTVDFLRLCLELAGGKPSLGPWGRYAMLRISRHMRSASLSGVIGSIAKAILLHDPFDLNALTAAEILSMMEVGISDRDVGEHPRTIDGNPELGLTRYLDRETMWLSEPEQQQWGIILGYARETSTPMRSIADILPIHSLADFNPNEERRSPILKRKIVKLRTLMKKYDGDQERVLRAFLGGKEPGAVLRVDNDKSLVVQGHHRLAALVVAASRGVIPPSWLAALPLKVLDNATMGPKRLQRRILTSSVSLTWQDLFPPSMEMHALLMKTMERSA